MPCRFMLAESRLRTSSRALSKPLRTVLSLVLLSLNLGYFSSAQAQSSDPVPAAAPAAASAPEAGSNVPAALPAASAALPSAIAVPRLTLPDWAELSAQQRVVLAPLARDWNQLDASSRSKWLELAARFGSVPAEEQWRIQERMRDWAKLSPSERQKARAGYQFAQQVTADERRAKWDAYQALPAEQKQALAERAAAKVSKQASAALAGKAGSHPTNSSAAPVNKTNLVPMPSKLPQAPAVAPTVLQAKPGATTVLITQIKVMPSHLGAGLPKVLANPEWVDSKTLLPKQQGASGIPSSTSN
jgi:hypothetical protein